MFADKTRSTNAYKKQKFSDNSEGYNESDFNKKRKHGDPSYARNKLNANWQKEDRHGFNQWNYNSQGNFRDKSTFKSKRQNQENFVDVPRPGKPRKYTISIAVPATILEDTCIKDELRTYVVGQIARAANIYSIDEIVVYNDRNCNKDCLVPSVFEKGWCP
ncbi:hypothetical protein OTU49_002500 [Cherax quadricarinatus]|uniref:Uncharacterized protein n=1 Tax=Cherax quadricarinatus TaxID=27406 RepID=A0AAW0X9R8_CHEQU